MQKNALILLHPGFEEMEAAAPIDILVRAGLQVVQASTSESLRVEGRNGMTWEATHRFTDVADEPFDVILIPGGPGVKKLRGRSDIVDCLRSQHAAKKLLACICAAPLLLLDAGLISGLDYTAHPSTAAELGQARQVPVVVDGSIITSQGAGTATEFALAVAEALLGRETATQVAQAICWSHALDGQANQQS
jgi:4-methyl-5(b-hydroxyethyl)-thiazole monophosphate biosynthesis